MRSKAAEAYSDMGGSPRLSHWEFGATSRPWDAARSILLMRTYLDGLAIWQLRAHLDGQVRHLLSHLAWEAICGLRTI